MKKPENQKHTGRIIRNEIHTGASPQYAWEAWADPEKIAGWFVDRASGKAEAGASITWFFDSFNMALPYRVLEAIPGERFSILWEGPMPPPGILEIIIERQGNETLMRLVNSGFREGAQWDEEYEGILSGWHMSLGLLRHYLEAHFAAPRKTIFLMRPAQFTYDQIDPYFRDPARLAEWLTESAGDAHGGATLGIGDEADQCKLMLRDGRKLKGYVIARTAHEVAITWPEQDAVLELKSFSMGPQKMLAVRVSAWNCPPERAKEIEAMVGAALDRLTSALRSPHPKQKSIGS
jgi:uncharacterized protein YndB with AHSA1/START domain